MTFNVYSDMRTPQRTRCGCAILASERAPPAREGKRLGRAAKISVGVTRTARPSRSLGEAVVQMDSTECMLGGQEHGGVEKTFRSGTEHS